jgi:hypothetical protein
MTTSTTSTTSLFLHCFVALPFGQRAVGRTYVVFNPRVAKKSYRAVRLRLQVLGTPICLRRYFSATQYSLLLYHEKDGPSTISKAHCVHLHFSRAPDSVLVVLVNTPVDKA